MKTGTSVGSASPSNTACPSCSFRGPESGVTSCWTIDGSAPAACASFLLLSHFATAIS
jgi:hypothetical protein